MITININNTITGTSSSYKVREKETVELIMDKLEKEMYYPVINQEAIDYCLNCTKSETACNSCKSYKK